MTKTLDEVYLRAHTDSLASRRVTFGPVRAARYPGHLPRTTSGEASIQVDIFAATERRGNELYHFIASALPQEEQSAFIADIMAANAVWRRSGSAEQLILALRDWEATAEIYADAALAKELEGARSERDTGCFEQPA